LRNWLRRLLGVDRIERQLALLPYLGQPIYWHPKKGLVVYPRRTLRRRFRRQGTRHATQ
jgi:hypothetical protein